MQPDAGAYLWEAAEAARLIREFANGKTESEFNSDLVLRSAVERQFEILGEALNRLRKVDRDIAARIPAAGKVIGMRNIIAHDYGHIDYEIVWRAVTKRIPTLIPILNQLVQEARIAAGL